MVKKLTLKDLLVGENKISVVITDPQDYLEESGKAIKNVINEKHIPGVYVTINKPYDVIKAKFEKIGVNTKMMIFIDAISKETHNITKEKGCLFIQTPTSLSDLSIAVSEAVNALPSKEKFVFFDSITTLLIYNEAHSVLRFIHFLTNKMRSWGVNGVILSVDSDTKSKVFQQIVLFADNTINLTKGGK